MTVRLLSRNVGSKAAYHILSRRNVILFDHISHFKPDMKNCVTYVLRFFSIKTAFLSLSAAPKCVIIERYIKCIRILGK